MRALLTNLLQVGDIVWIEAGCSLEELQGLIDLSSLALDERLDVDGIFGHAAAVLELLIDRL